MLSCPKCGRELKSCSGLTQHLKFCKGKKYCFNPNCKIELKDYQTKFCSRKCAALINSPGRKHTEETRIKISLSLKGSGKLKPIGVRKCLCCRINIKYPKKFCNHSCQQRYYFEQNVKKWLSGEIDGTAKSGHKAFIKRYLLEKYDNKCSRCGWGERNTFTNSIPLEVEHIDGNAYNNCPSNVTLLCPNCQSLTSTYKGANRGNGRRIYMKEYYYANKNNKMVE